MTITASPWTLSSFNATGRTLIHVPLQTLDALSGGDLREASALSKLALTPYIVNECAKVWRMRAEQIRANPEDGPWVTRLLVKLDGTVVGRAGFHGRPDGEGMVEVGYSIDPIHRRQGHARAGLEILMDIARRDPEVKRLRATVSPENTASRALVESFGLREVGEQWDEEDGLEIIFEVECEII